MRPFLPAEILDKKKHGFGPPFGVWTASHADLNGLIKENLGRLGPRQIVRNDFLREALDLHQHGHVAYYGELIWMLAVLEMCGLPLGAVSLSLEEARSGLFLDQSNGREREMTQVTAKGLMWRIPGNR